MLSHLFFFLPRVRLLERGNLLLVVCQPTKQSFGMSADVNARQRAKGIPFGAGKFNRSHYQDNPKAL